MSTPLADSLFLRMMQQRDRQLDFEAQKVERGRQATQQDMTSMGTFLKDMASAQASTIDSQMKIAQQEGVDLANRGVEPEARGETYDDPRMESALRRAYDSLSAKGEASSRAARAKAAAERAKLVEQRGFDYAKTLEGRGYKEGQTTEERGYDRGQLYEGRRYDERQAGAERGRELYDRGEQRGYEAGQEHEERIYKGGLLSAKRAREDLQAQFERDLKLELAGMKGTGGSKNPAKNLMKLLEQGSSGYGLFAGTEASRAKIGAARAILNALVDSGKPPQAILAEWAGTGQFQDWAATLSGSTGQVLQSILLGAYEGGAVPQGGAGGGAAGVGVGPTQSTAPPSRSKPASRFAGRMDKHKAGGG